jgi:hypothetical protein
MKRITLEESQNYQVYVRTPLSPPPHYYTIEVVNGWENVKYYTNHSKTNNSEEGSEYVYVLKNEYMPGIFKIGYTYNDPSLRANQLFKTGVPTEFEVAYSIKCLNGMRIERASHECLKQYRIRNDREFFKVDLETIIQTLEKMKENYG